MQDHWVDTALNWLVLASGRISGYTILVMALLMTTDVILRFVFNAATKFATEISAYMLVASVSLGLAYTLRERTHIRIDLITSRLPKRLASWLQVVTSFLALIFTSTLLWLTWGQFAISFTLQTTSTTSIDMLIWPVQVLIPLGLLIISLLLTLNIYVETKVALGRVGETKQEGQAGL